MIVTNDCKFSILNFFFTKRFYTHQKHKTAYSKQKIKNTYKKHLRAKNLLVRLLAFCAFSA